MFMKNISALDQTIIFLKVFMTQFVLTRVQILMSFVNSRVVVFAYMYIFSLWTDVFDKDALQLRCHNVSIIGNTDAVIGRDFVQRMELFILQKMIALRVQ